MTRSLGAEARQAVLRQLITAAKAWSALEERYEAEGRTTEAVGAHVHGEYVLRAYEAEMNDPAPLRRAS